MPLVKSFDRRKNPKDKYSVTVIPLKGFQTKNGLWWPQTPGFLQTFSAYMSRELWFKTWLLPWAAPKRRGLFSGHQTLCLLFRTCPNTTVSQAVLPPSPFAASCEGHSISCRMLMRAATGRQTLTHGTLIHSTHIYWQQGESRWYKSLSCSSFNPDAGEGKRRKSLSFRTQAPPFAKPAPLTKVLRGHQNTEE